MTDFDNQYQKALERIVSKGTVTSDRTGTGVRKVFGQQFRVNVGVDKDLSSGQSQDEDKIPALTLRKVFPRTSFCEIYWMLSGSTDVNVLKNMGVNIWNANSSRDFLDKQRLYHIQEGHIGRGYGRQFRDFNGVDQLYNVARSLINDPNGRRHFISLWNPNDLGDCALPPCHVTYQFVVIDGVLNLSLYQRSGDMILGVPMNMMNAAFFLHFMARLTGNAPGEIIHTIGDCHVYENHMDAAIELIKREPTSDRYALFQQGANAPVYGCRGTRELNDAIKYALQFFSKYPKQVWEETFIQGYLPNPPIPKEMLPMAT